MFVLRVHISGFLMNVAKQRAGGQEAPGGKPNAPARAFHPPLSVGSKIGEMKSGPATRRCSLNASGALNSVDPRLPAADRDVIVAERATIAEFLSCSVAYEVRLARIHADCYEFVVGPG